MRRGGRLHRFFAAAGRRSAVRRNAIRLRRARCAASPRPSMRRWSACSRPMKIPTREPSDGLEPGGRELAGMRRSGGRFWHHAGRAKSSRRGACDSDALLELLGDIDRPNVKVGFRRLVAGLARRRAVRRGRTNGPLHGDHDQCRLPPLAPLSLSRRTGELRAPVSPTWCGRCRLAKGSSITGVLRRTGRRGLRRPGELRNVLARFAAAAAWKISTAAPAAICSGCDSTSFPARPKTSRYGVAGRFPKVAGPGTVIIINGGRCDLQFVTRQL